MSLGNKLRPEPGRTGLHLIDFRLPTFNFRVKAILLPSTPYYSSVSFYIYYHCKQYLINLFIKTRTNNVHSVIILSTPRSPSFSLPETEVLECKTNHLCLEFNYYIKVINYKRYFFDFIPLSHLIHTLRVKSLSPFPSGEIPPLKVRLSPYHSPPSVHYWTFLQSQSLLLFTFQGLFSHRKRSHSSFRPSRPRRTSSIRTPDSSVTLSRTLRKG